MRRERCDSRTADTATALTEWRQALWSRRSFLLRMAGGSVLALFGRGTLAEEAETLDEARRWETAGCRSAAPVSVRGGQPGSA